MKQKLTLLLIALVTSMGAWAATPNILALPQPGKIYYISGYNEAQGKTAYLWADGTALKGDISYTKAGDYAYLWLCAKTENGYTFQNLSTGKYILSATSGRHASVEGTSANASAFKLSETVQDSKCISFQSGDGDPRWMAVSLTESKNVDRLTGSYNYFSSQWCTDYLLEEYAAQTLSHNQYYYIYCDNDDSDVSGTDRPQYVYNSSSSTIPVQTDKSQVSLTNYAWRAIRHFDSSNPTRDYFYFKNDSKYLAFHSLSDESYAWYTNRNSSIIGAGRVMLWSDVFKGGRYMAFNYNDTENSNNGGYSIGDTGLQKTGAWSQDFMFVVAPQTNVYRVAIKTEGLSTCNPVFTYDGFDYSGDCSIYVDGNNLPETKTISLKSSNSAYTFKGFYLEDGTSLGTTIDVSALTANKGVKAVFYPFKLSANFASATWYYMTVNGEYAVAVEPNPIVEEAYPPYPMYETKQISENALWAFVDNSGDGFFIVNYAKGSGKYLNLYTPATFETSGYTKCYHVWDGGNVYIYNDPSDPWYLIDNIGADPNILSSSRTKDNGALTFEAVDWIELAKATIDAYADSHARGEYFGADESLITATKNTIDEYAAVFNKTYYEAITGDMSGLTKYPTTGYYRIYNPTRSRYMGTTDGNPFTIDDATGASTVVRLEYDGENKKYKIQMQGLELDAPEYNTTMTMSASGSDFTAEGTDGTGAFKSGTYYVHAGNYNWTTAYGLLGYFAPSSDAASGWTVTDASSVTVTLNSDGASPTATYYATFCAPFSYTVSTSGVTAYTLEESGDWLIPTAVEGEVTAGTPVLLKGTSSTATLTIGTGYAATPVTGTALTGTYLATTIDGENDFVLGIKDGIVGFYHWDSSSLGANRAYFDTPETPTPGVKGFIVNWGDETGIENLNVNDNHNKDNETIYNLAGQRVQKAQKGLYIVNGKKVLVK